MTSRTATLKLYRNMIRSGKKIDHYNFREYAIRRIRFEFKAHTYLESSEQVVEKLNVAVDQHKMLCRMQTMSNLYHGENSVLAR